MFCRPLAPLLGSEAPPPSHMDLLVPHMREVRGLDLVVVKPPAEIALHELVEELDVLGQRLRQLLGGAVDVGHRDAAHELAVVERVAHGRVEPRREVRVLDALPEAEEAGHRLNERGGLGAEDDGQLADGVAARAVQLDLVLDGRAVFVFERALQRHAVGVRREEGHEVARWRHELLDRGEDVVDAAFGSGVVDVLGEDLVDEVGAVGAHTVRQRVDLAHDLVVQHQAVKCFFHCKTSMRPRRSSSRCVVGAPTLRMRL